MRLYVTLIELRLLLLLYAKTTNIAELKTALLSIWNDLPQEFTYKAILSFRKRLRFCVCAAGRHFEHPVYIPRGQLTFTTETFEVLMKKLCKV